MSKRISLSREAALATLPESAPAWELHGFIARAASDALHNHLRAARWEAEHGRKTYGADRPAEYAARHARLVAERKEARKARTAWERADEASLAAFHALPASLQKASYSGSEWASRMGLTP